MYCPQCGKEIAYGSKICPECRTNIPNGGETVSLGDWFVTILLTAIPLVGLVMQFVWAFGGGVPESKKNWARATLIWIAIGIVLLFIFGSSLIAILVGMSN